MLFDFTTGTSGSTNPDFAGDPMRFGLASITRIFPGSQLSNATIETDFDNLNFQINDPIPFEDGTFNLTNYSVIVFAAPVPEPATLLLLTFGLGLTRLAGYAKRRFFKG